MEKPFCPSCGKEFDAGFKVCPFDGTALILRSQDPFAGKVIDGRYRVLFKLGEGGMGAVYKATQISTGKPVAIKTISRELAAHEATIQRFQREVGIQSKLSHPNIVSLIDFSRMDGGDYFFVMEFVEGVSLRRQIMEHGRFSLDEFYEFAGQILDGLEYAHRQGVVHRDLKGSNIIIAKAGHQKIAKILDFGLAKAHYSGDDSRTAEDLTGTGRALGTPAYMSPEQAKGDSKKVGPASDQYSAGVIFYEMLTGRLPFESDTPWGYLHKHVAQPPPPVRAERPDVPERVEKVLLRLLAKEPEKRFPSALAAKRALLGQGGRISETDAATELEKTIDAKAKGRRGRVAALLAVAVVLAAALGAMQYDGLFDFVGAQHAVPVQKEPAPSSVGAQHTVPVQKEPAPSSVGAQHVSPLQQEPAAPTVGAQHAVPLQKKEEEAARLKAEEEKRLAEVKAAEERRKKEEEEARLAAEMERKRKEEETRLAGEKKRSEELAKEYLALAGQSLAARDLKKAEDLIAKVEGLAPDMPEARRLRADIEEKKKVPEGMVFVKGGCFDMGDTFGDGGGFWAAFLDVGPVHRVCVDDFLMDKYEVTQAAYTSVIGKNPSKFAGCGDCPVEQVTWYEANDYCSRVGKRLPTEAEWEYAARSGGRVEKYAGGGDVDRVGWYEDNSGGRTHPVGGKAPNGLGLYDMSGNVWEWVADWYGKGYYANSPEKNPKGPASGTEGWRVLRGGSWYTHPSSARASNRLAIAPTSRSLNIGFRCSQ